MSRPDPVRLRAAFDALAPVDPAERQSAVAEWVRRLDLPDADREPFAAELLELLAQLEKGKTSLDRPITPVELRNARRPRSEPLRIEGFEIVDLIGEGGSSSVYAAVAIGSGTRHALKVLHAEATDTGELRRFEREVAALSRFAHPFLARIDRIGSCEIDGRPHPYIAMELVDGLSLDAWCRERAPSLAERVALMSEIAEGVHHAHTRGVIHRDLKPANIMVDPEGHPRIIDFGVARWSNANQSRTELTAAGDVVGTLTYLSPEQASGGQREVDGRADVHALGLIACEVFSGRRARDFASMPFHAALRCVENEEAAQLPPLADDPGRDLAKIVAHATMREPRDRYVSAQAFADDLKRYLRDEPVAAPSDDVVRRFRRGIRRYRLAIGVSGIAILVLGGATYSAIVGRHEARAKESHARAIYQVLREALVPVDPSRLDRRATVEDVLKAAASGIDALEDPSPEMEDEVRTLLARAFEHSGTASRMALVQWLRVFELRRDEYSARDARTRLAASFVASGHYVLGEFPQAREWIMTHVLRDDLYTGESGELEDFELRAHVQLAILDAYDSKFQEACDRLEPLVISELESGGPASTRAAFVICELAKVWLLMGHFGDTEAIVEPVVLAQRAIPGVDPDLLLDLESRLVTAFLGRGDAVRVFPLAERVAADRTRLLGPHTIKTLESCVHVARCLGHLGRTHEAIEAMRKVLAAAPEFEHSAEFDVGYAVDLAEQLVMVRCYEEAEALLSAQLGSDLSKAPVRYAKPLAMLGFVYLSTNRSKEAVNALERANEYSLVLGAERSFRANLLTLLALARLKTHSAELPGASIDGGEGVENAGDPIESIVAMLAEAESLCAIETPRGAGGRVDARVMLAAARSLQRRFGDADAILKGLLAETLTPQQREKVERTLRILEIQSKQ